MSADTRPAGITTGPDGNIWFTEYNTNKVGRITPGGSVTEFTIPTSQPLGIAGGPDGNVWFTEFFAGRIARITPTGTVTEFPVPTGSSELSGISRGPDGNLWFTESAPNQIGRITTAGVVTEYRVPNTIAHPTGVFPDGITVGPDGNLWFASSSLNGGEIGRASTSGAISVFPAPADTTLQLSIAAGPDGALWFPEANAIKSAKSEPAETSESFLSRIRCFLHRTINLLASPWDRTETSGLRTRTATRSQGSRGQERSSSFRFRRNPVFPTASLSDRMATSGSPRRQSTRSAGCKSALPPDRG